MVFNLGKLGSIGKPKIEQILAALTYLLHFVVENLLIPGQIETWVVIVDLGGNQFSANTGSVYLFIQIMKDLIKFMQSNFKSRLNNMYMVRIPKSINFVWNLMKSFLDEVTTQKIKLIENDIPIELFTHTNSSQIEKKYGGSSQNLDKEFWFIYYN